jgi:hypothetical protein
LSICEFSVMILLKAGREASRQTAGPVSRIIRFYTQESACRKREQCCRTVTGY